MNEPQRDVKGIWIPIKLWECKELTMFEKTLIAEIDSLDCGEGCWASSKYLAEFFDCSISHVLNTFCILKQMGLITINRVGNRRFVKVNWNKLVKKAPTEKSRSHLLSPVGGTHTTYELDNKERAGRAVAPARSSFFGDNGDGYDRTPSGMLAKFFHEKAIRLNWCNTKERKKPSPKVWMKEINLLLEVHPKERVREVMEWYLKNWRNSYVPVAQTIPTFCEKFDRIERAMIIAEPSKKRKKRTIIEHVTDSGKVIRQSIETDEE